MNIKILVPGDYDSVLPLTEEEKNLYKDIDFDLYDYLKKCYCAITKLSVSLISAQGVLSFGE